MTSAKRLSKGTNTNANGRVYTPSWLAKEAVEWAGVNPDTICYEPCSGEGSFLEHLPEGSKWAEIDRGVDFFEYDPGPIDLVITNPPYSCMGDFIYHMLTVIKPRRMVLLAPITNLVTKKRLRDTFNAGYSFGRTSPLRQIPRSWPSTGFQHVLQEYVPGPGWEYLEVGRDG